MKPRNWNDPDDMNNPETLEAILNAYSKPRPRPFSAFQLAQLKEVEECMRLAKLPVGTFTEPDVAWLHQMGICLPEEASK